MNDHNVYQVTLTETEFAILAGLYAVGDRLVNRRVDNTFNATWTMAEFTIQKEPEALVSLETKLSALARQAQENLMAENPGMQEKVDDMRKYFGLTNGEVT